jgi:hypothetical protein
MDQVFPGLSSSPLLTAYTRTCRQSRKSQNLTHVRACPYFWWRPLHCVYLSRKVLSLIIGTHHNTRDSNSLGCSSMLITQRIQKQQHLCQQVDALHLPLTPCDVIIDKIRKESIAPSFTVESFSFSSLFSALNHTTLWNNNNNNNNIKVKLTLE